MTIKTDNVKLATAITRELETAEPGIPCPPLEEIACLADGTLEGGERDRLLLHLSQCGRCRELFVTTRELSYPQPAEERRRYLLPSSFAAAAVLIVALTFTLKEEGGDKLRLAKRDETPGAKAPIPGAARERAGESALAAKDPSPAAGPAAAKVRGAATVERLARRLMKGGEASGVALALPVDRNFGFAAKAGGSSLAFQAGVSALDLELALASGDSARAQARTVRLASLLQAASAKGDTAGMEQLGEKLEKGAKPASFAGASGRIEGALPRESVAYYRLGAWAQGARIAASSGNRGYFAGGLPALADAEGAGMWPKAAATLRELKAKLQDPQRMDLAAVAEEAEELCGDF